MKKQNVSLLALLLTASVFFASCHNSANKRAADALGFDSLRVNQTVHLFGDTAKPACNLTANLEMLPYASGGVVFAGLLYLLMSALITVFGVRKIMRLFPPVVTGPIIISIGLILAPSAISNCAQNWLLAVIALGTVVICNIWGKGMVKILPILIGVPDRHLRNGCAPRPDQIGGHRRVRQQVQGLHEAAVLRCAHEDGPVFSRDDRDRLTSISESYQILEVVGRPLHVDRLHASVYGPPDIRYRHVNARTVWKHPVHAIVYIRVRICSRELSVGSATLHQV